MLPSSRLHAKEFTFDKSSSIKLTIYQILCNWNGNTFSFIPYVCYFLHHSSIAASEGRSLRTPFFTKMRGEETQLQEHQHPCPILLEFCHSSPPFRKKPKKSEVEHVRHLH